MTTGCVEYWLLLHYEMCKPSIQTSAEKDDVETRLRAKMPSYKKGSAEATAKIAKDYPKAVNNARVTISDLQPEGLPSLVDSDERNRWLCRSGFTFSTVYEAIDFLTGLKNARPNGLK